jgi:nicotinamidase-related amidase
MPYDSLDPAKTGVLFFDMLNAGFGTHDEAYRKMKAGIVANCVRVREGADASSIPVFFARADHRPDGRDAVITYSDLSRQGTPWQDPENDRLRPYRTNLAGEWGSQIIDELKAGPDDYLIAKHRKSAFFQTNLELSLRALGIDTMVLCGSAIGSGIAATVYSAQDRDFDIVVVRDACNPSEGPMHDVFMNRVFARIGRVRTTGEVLEMMRLGAAPRAR